MLRGTDSSSHPKERSIKAKRPFAAPLMTGNPQLHPLQLSLVCVPWG